VLHCAEVQAARHAGMQVLGLSIISNNVVFPGDEAATPASHAEVLATTQARESDVQKLVEAIISRINDPDPGVVVKTENGLSQKKGAVALVQKVKDLDLSSLTPLQAMSVLIELKAMVNS